MKVRAVKTPTPKQLKINQTARNIAQLQGWNANDPKLMHKLIANLEAGKELHSMPPKRNPKKLERCVKAVKKRKSAVNAYAVCTAATRKKNPEKKQYKEFPVYMGSSLKNMKLVWTAATQKDAIFIAKIYAEKNPDKFVRIP
jgi:hypothetical protein